jgi:phage terminase large subunit-like protein
LSAFTLGSLPSLKEIQAEKTKRGLSAKSNWREIARDEQIRPDDCDTFTLIGGRGSGKTRAGAEDFMERVRAGVQRLHIVAPTFADGRDVCVEGDSGIKSVALPGEIANWNRSMGEIFFSNGAQAKIFAAVEPDRLNGPQCQHLWCDEFGLYGDTAAIDMALFGLRLGDRVTSCWTSTPKMTRSTKYVLKHTEESGGIRRRMRTRDNADNLAPSVVDALERKYGGTRLGRAELEGEEIDEVEGALWERVWLEREGFRLPPAIFKKDGKVVFEPPKQVVRTVVALDPTVSDPELKKNPHKELDACGITVVGIDEIGQGYVLGDYTAVLPPAEWAQIALRLYSLTRAYAIVAEANQGGELIREVIKGYGTANVQLVHASLAKRPRAEPVAMLYEQGRVKHCGEFRDLEDQMCSWNAADPSQRSPNNIDSLVWGFHGLGLCDATGGRVIKTINTKEADDED